MSVREDVARAVGRAFADLVVQVNTGELYAAIEHECAHEMLEPKVFEAMITLRDLVSHATADPSDY